ncbi:MAG TPA: class I SAM-dependent methyltransferase [Chlamydiales bacterium]|jgi:predicted O-methyltransferase YrrM
MKLGKSTPVDLALQFIDSIESTWKGHEQFALWLVQKLKPKTIVDLGFDQGLSTVAFAYKNKNQVFGIDWFEQGRYSEKCSALDRAFGNIANAIRFNYVKNIHLIIGPFSHVSKGWHRKIDLLHIDWAHSYTSVKTHYENWRKFLTLDGIILIHDVTSHPKEVGRFFNEIELPKFLFPESSGLGVICANQALLNEIQASWKRSRKRQAKKV